MVQMSIGSRTFSIFRQVSGFGLAGIAGFSVEYSIISISVINGYGPVAPRFISQPLAILVTFFINRYFTFGNSTPLAAKEVGAYYLGMWASAAMSFVIYAILIFYNLTHTKSLIFATFVGAVLNFSFSRFLFLKQLSRRKDM